MIEQLMCRSLPGDHLCGAAGFVRLHAKVSSPHPYLIAQFVLQNREQNRALNRLLPGAVKCNRSRRMLYTEPFLLSMSRSF